MKFKSLLLAVFVFVGTVNATSTKKATDNAVAAASIFTHMVNAVVAVPSQVKTGCEKLVNSKCVQAQVKFVKNHKVAVGVTAAVVAAAIAYAVYKNKNDKKN